MTDPFRPPTGEQPQQPVPPQYGAPQYGAPQYQPPQYGAPLYGGPVIGPARNGFGVAALVLGILSIVTFWTFVGGIVFGILGVVFGVLGRRRAKRGEATNGGVALAGAITGAVGLVVGVAFVVLAVVLATSDSGKRYQDCLDRAGSDQSARAVCNEQFAHDLTT
jgi:hypothetical protein